MFGSNTPLADGTLADNGFQVLAELDDNGDGVIDTNDSVFNELKIWQDTNQNGLVDDGEMSTLSDAGIQGIHTSFENTSFIDENGNKHLQTGSVLLENGETAKAEALEKALAPLFALVTVKTEEDTEMGPVVCKAKNPLGIKTLMAVLGLPSGGCRQPLGRLTAKAMETLMTAARQVYANAPELFEPMAEFFGVQVEERLNNPKYCEGLYYTDY